MVPSEERSKDRVIIVIRKLSSLVDSTATHWMLVLAPGWQGRLMETGKDWGNPTRKEISSASEIGEDWQQGHQPNVPPERHS